MGGYGGWLASICMRWLPSICARALHTRIYTRIPPLAPPTPGAPGGPATPHTVTIQPKLSLLESEMERARARARVVAKTKRQRRMRKRIGGVQRAGQVVSEEEDSCSTSMRKREACEREG
jgi:hypothetical protein